MSVSYGLARSGLPASSSFRRWVEATLVGARFVHAAEVSIRLVGEAEGRTLNRDYRGRDYATNVLSFPAELPAELPMPLLGDLAMCAPVVAREARTQRKPLRHHYAHLTVHGVLHLIGFDHAGDADATRMEHLETHILAGLGIADPYA